LDIIFMGTASAAGSADRDNTYLLFKHREEGWLIDVGGNPLGKLKQASTPLDQIKGVILTHFHVDHIYGLPSLLWGMWIAGRTEPLTVYCPETGESQLKAIISSYQAEEWPIRFDIHIHAFDWTKECDLLENNGIAISAFPALHAVPTAGLKVQFEDRILIYSADTRPNEWIRNQPRIDLLIHEASAARGTMKSHTSLEDLLRFYPLDRIGKVVAVHLADHQPYHEILAGCSESARSKVILASDMMKASL
jgi:ribonuclease Z